MQANAPQPPRNKRSHRAFYYGYLIIVLAICITGVYLFTTGVNNRLSKLESLTYRQASELSEMREQVFNASLLEGRYTSLNARMGALGNAIASLDRKLGQRIPQRLPGRPVQGTPAAGGDSPGQINSPARPESLKPAAAKPPSGKTPVAGLSNIPESTPVAGTRTDALPAAEATVRAGAAQLQPTSAGPTSGPKAVAGKTAVEMTPQTPVTGASMASKKTATQTPAKPATTSKKGPWAINLMSSRNKGNMELSAARARSMDIAVEIHSAEVKGRTYWRLQVTGFPTVRAAKAAAVPVKEKLGIDDVWIVRQNTVSGRM